MASVQIQEEVSIKYGDGKFVRIPHELVVAEPWLELVFFGKFLQIFFWHKSLTNQTTEDQYGTKYLKFMATNQSIINLVCGGCQQKNASLSSSGKLKELKDLRNAKLGIAAEETEEGQGQGDPALKKRKLSEVVVTFAVDGVDIKCLCPQKRAALADLQIELDTSMLAAVISALKEDCISLQPKPRKKKVVKEQQGWHETKSCHKLQQWAKSFYVPPQIQ